MFIFWGKHFFGRRNLTSAVRLCTRCRRVTKALSFDTFLVGHLYAIPLIPLGRRHIHHKCTGCGAFYEFAPEKWQADLSAAHEKVRQHYDVEPLRLEYALEALEAFDVFGPPDRANEVAARLEAHFSGEPEVRARLVRYFAQHGQVEKAAQYTASVTGPSTADDGTTRQLVNAAIASRDFVAAKKLLLTIREPSLTDFRNAHLITQGLVAAKQDRDAHETYAFMFRFFPKQASNTTAVSNARALEKRLGIRTSIVPANVRTPPNGLVIGASIAVAVVAFFVANAFLEKSQPLYFVNGTRSAADITVDGEALHVGPGSKVERSVSEGSHTIRVKLENGYAYERTIGIVNDLPRRFLRKNAFVFDVLGAAVLAHDEVVYGPGDAPRGDLIAGDDFVTFHDVDYAFEPPPGSLETKSGSEVRIALSIEPADPARVLGSVLQHPDAFKHVNGRRFAEGHLLGGDATDELVGLYRVYCQNRGCEKDAEALLAKLGLGRGEQAAEKPEVAVPAVP